MTVLVEVPAPGRLDEEPVRTVLDRASAATRFGNASMLVVLQPGQTGWRPNGGEFTGPGLVHYYRYRDNGDIGAVWIAALTVADVVRSAALGGG